MSSGLGSRRPEVLDFGDAALLVVFGSVIDPHLNQTAHALAARVSAQRREGLPWRAPVPSYASVLLPYDVSVWNADEARSAVEALLDVLGDSVGAEADVAPVIEIPVRYGGGDGPDLDEVADRCRLRPADVVELHASIDYRAYLLGFAPGFAYLGVLPERLRIPRRDTPRTRVPAGSVAIAGRQTAVYPLSTPGGWHLIGRTDVPIWDASREAPALIAAGATVRFVPA